MESTRQKKFAREIQRALSQILHREIQGLQGVMLTLSHVKVTPDLQLVRAYITCFPESQSNEIVAFLNDEQKKIRTLLARHIKNQVKVMPTLEFYYDDTAKTAARLDELFEQIRQNDQKPQEGES